LKQNSNLPGRIILGGLFSFAVYAFLECGLLAQQPNIILLMSDDQGWGDVGYNGHAVLQTPELDKLASEGLKMTNFFSGAPNCSPTRATCLTGRHHHRSGVPDHSKPINPSEPTIADALAANGYRTGLFGKWHLGEVGRGAYNHPGQLGFDVWFATKNNEDKVNPSSYRRNGSDVGTVTGEDSQIIMDETLRFIQDSMKRNQPFLAYVWFHTPHTPNGSTPDYLDMYADLGLTFAQQEYYAQITAMDAQVGRLRRELRRLGVAENTLLVFTSDNGTEASLLGSNGPYSGGKGSLSGEGGVRVPGLIEWPAKIPSAAVSATPMVTTDFYATFLAAAGVSAFGPARTLDSENLLPLLTTGTYTRSKPIRFYHRGGKKVVMPSGEWGKSDLDAGYDTWLSGVTSDYTASLDAIDLLKTNAVPSASISAPQRVVESDTDGQEEIVFDGSSSSDPEGTSLEFEWTVLDQRVSGTPASLILPVGVHEVKLRVTDGHGLTGQTTHMVWIQGEEDNTNAHMESGGQVVLEAEHPSWQQEDLGPLRWRIGSTQSGYMGSGYVETRDQNSANIQNWSDPGSILSYPLVISTPGTYTLWLRRFAADSQSAAVNIGLNNVAVILDADGDRNDYKTWVWKEVGNVSFTTGTHVLQIKQRRDGYKIDRILLTTNSSYTPAGDRPAENARSGVYSFASFMQQYPALQGIEAGPKEDPDADGLTNEQEFYRRTDPTTPSMKDTFQVRTGLIPPVLEYRYRRRAAIQGMDQALTGQVEATHDLSGTTWSSAPEGEHLIEQRGIAKRLSAEVEEVTIWVQLVGLLREYAFVRLNISK